MKIMSKRSQQVLMEKVQSSFDAHLNIFNGVISSLTSGIMECASVMAEAIEKGRTIFWCGNGGSASDAEHLCAELVGRFNLERASLPSIALSSNTSTITSIGNDYGYDRVFSRQVEGLVREGDILVGISTSGNSKNIEHAIELANIKGCTTIVLTGREGGSLAQLGKYTLNVKGSDTARIQEMHILVGHILCDLIEVALIE